MTVTAGTSRSDYLGDGVQTEFPVGFQALVDADLAVYLTDPADISHPTKQVLSTHYTVTGNLAEGTAAIHLVTPPVSGIQVSILRDITISQTTDYEQYDDFPADSHERALDKLTMICQALREQFNRTVLYPVGATEEDVLDSVEFLNACASSRDLAQSAAATAATQASQASSAAIAAAASASQAAATDVGLLESRVTVVEADKIGADMFMASGDFIVGAGIGVVAVKTALEVASLLGGSSAGKLVQLDSNGYLPALDARNLTNIPFFDQTARDNAAMNAFLTHLGAGRATGAVPGGAMYTFLTDELATKTNATYDATGDYYYNQAAPNGTKTELSAAMVSIAGAAFDATIAKIVDGITAQNFGFSLYAGTAAGAGVQIDAGVGNSLDLSSLRLYCTNTGAVANFNVDYSDNGTTWTTIGAFTSVVNGWATFNNAQTVGRHRYLRVVTNVAQPANTAYFSELEVFEFAAPTNMSLAPTRVTLGFVPKTATVYILHKAVDTTTVLNTDLRVAVTRSTSGWVAASNLAPLCAYDGSYRLLKATVDLSSQEALTGVNWLITTLNAKSQRVRAALLWAE